MDEAAPGVAPSRTCERAGEGAGRTRDDFVEGLCGDTQTGELSHSVFYRTRRLKDDQPVLLKVLRAGSARTADIARFKHRYERIVCIDDPRVVKVFGVEEHGDGLVVVQEEGPSDDLAGLLAARGSSRSRSFSTRPSRSPTPRRPSIATGSATTTSGRATSPSARTSRSSSAASAPTPRSPARTRSSTTRASSTRSCPTSRPSRPGG